MGKGSRFGELHGARLLVCTRRTHRETPQSVIKADGNGKEYFFRTDHLMADLKGRSVRGGAVTLTAQGVKFALQMGSTMILARLLTPADFGLVAMVTAVTGFVAMFKDAGLSMATVQREQITHAQVSTLFWINVALSLVVMLVIAALAPPIAWFYGEPRLVWITLALSATFIFGGLTVQHEALLRRQMRFTALAATEIGSMAAGIATAVIMAWRGFGYWALVGLTAGSTIANCAIVWALSGWVPGRPRRGSGVRGMLKFGGGLTGFTFLNYFTRHADNVIIGYALGSASLGVYSKAYGLLMMPIQQINAPVSHVMVPSLSRLQGEPDRYRRAFLRAIGMLAFVGMPVVGLLFAVADEVVAVVLGSGWESAATVFRLLAPGAVLGTVNVAPGWLCVSLGRARVQLLWAAISAPIMVMAFVTGSHWGISGVAAGFSASWSVLFILFVAMACRESPVSFVQLVSCLATPLIACVSATVASMGVVLLALPPEAPVAGTLIASGILYVATYALVCLSLPSGRRQARTLLHDGIGALSASKAQETS